MIQLLLRELIEKVSNGQPVAYCRLVETRGSTPQKAGATMLVYQDGSQSGTLGGGCVEAEVKRKAIGVLKEGDREIVKFTLDNDYGWDDGLICGGRMQILIDPVRKESNLTYYQTLLDQINSDELLTETIIFSENPAELSPAQRFLFNQQNDCILSEPSFDLDSEKLNALTDQIIPIQKRPRPYTQEGVSYIPLLQKCTLLIVGGGHIGQAVGNLATDLDFDVWVVDDRESYISEERFPQAEKRICGPIGETLKNLPVDENTYCLIVTRGHNHDEEALYHLAERNARYVGMIGSRRKIKLIFDDLLTDGISSEALNKVYAPLGINIGSQTVPEIAISILAELISHRNLNGSVPGRPEKISTSL